MTGDIILGGTLEMSAEPLQAIADAGLWSSILTNRILAAAAVILVLADLGDVYDLYPHVKDCIGRSRGNISLEHSVSIARSRNVLAAILILPFCLVADRFGLFRPDFMDSIAPGWSVPVTAGIFALFCILMGIMTLLIRLRRMNNEERDAFNHSGYTYFIVLCVIALVTVGVMTLLHVSDNAVRCILYWETGLVYALSLLRGGQILAAHYSGLTTILYLCALKILVPGLLVAGALVL